MIGRIFWGIMGIALSYLIVKYRFKIGDTIGPIGLVEQYMGAGSTYTFLVFLAIFIFFLSLAYMTGSLDLFFQQNVEQYFGGTQPAQ